MAIIEIDGKKIEAEPGAMIIEVADNVGIEIPRFCYHKKLSIAANCRMCLVDVEKSPKPVPACATPVTDGMKIWTQSSKALIAQKAVMEFLLINHPLDCPICDQGGECELQDLALGYGKDVSRFTEGKRVVKDKDLGPLIATDMTRCIHCTRCVRFGTEIAGQRELGATGRGEHMEIGTFIEQNIDSEVSGNVIDLCPVGALTSKPFRFTARGWELTQKPSVSPHDGVGSNLFLHVRRNQVMRVVPKENESINEVWLSDRDRFSYEGLYHPERLQQPKIKRNGRWYSASWEDALKKTANILQELISTEGANALGAWISPNATLEEGFLFQKLMRGLGCPNIDYRLRQEDFQYQDSVPLFLGLDLPINHLEQQSAVLLVGSNIRKEEPLLGLKLRKMVSNGGKLLVINPMDFAFNCDVSEKLIVPGGELVLGLAKVAKAILNLNAQSPLQNTLPKGVEHWLKEVTPQEQDLKIAKSFIENDKKLILLGALASTHPAFSQLIYLGDLISRLTGSKLGILSEGCNSVGAWLTGCVPHQLPGGKRLKLEQGLNAKQMWEQPLKGYVLFNLEPDLDCINGIKAITALQKAKQVIAITPFESKSLLENADILLPMTPFSEMEGTWVNMEGQWQNFQPAVLPMADSRPAWKILRVLGNFCHLEGFDFDTVEAVRAALSEEILKAHHEIQTENSISNLDSHQWHWECPKKLEGIHRKSDIVRLAQIPLYASDNLVRRAKSLQATIDAGSNTVYLNKRLKDRLQLSNEKIRVTANGIGLTLPWKIDDALPDNTVSIDSGIKETVSLGGAYTVVELENG